MRVIVQSLLTPEAKRRDVLDAKWIGLVVFARIAFIVEVHCIRPFPGHGTTAVNWVPR